MYPHSGYNSDVDSQEKPRKSTRRTKNEHIKLRLTSPEKEAFQMAANLAGLSLSDWVRERLRRASIRELESAGLQIPFLQELSERENWRSGTGGKPLCKECKGLS